MAVNWWIVAFLPSVAYPRMLCVPCLSVCSSRRHKESRDAGDIRWTVHT